eukprot:m.53820 g.53820  ORF g.53820 m.53820 type:complete len:418 (+) comp7686_c0_seq4:36-1289(+)
MAKQGGTMQNYFYKDASEGKLVKDPLRPAFHGQPNMLDASGPKLSGYISPAGMERECRYLAQMGVTHCFTWYETFSSVSLTKLEQLQSTARNCGITLNNVGVLSLGKSKNIIRGTALRDKDIEDFKVFIGWLSQLGIPATTFTWEAEGVVYSTGKALVRGGCQSRYLDAEVLERMSVESSGVCEENSKAHDGDEKEMYVTMSKHERLDRRYDGEEDIVLTEEHLWSTMEHFLNEIIPICEETKVKLLLHPNDPPLAMVCGIPNLIRSKHAFDKVFHLANESPWIGMEFCCGTWMEGVTVEDSFCKDAPRSQRGEFGDGIGALYTTLAHFIERDRVGILHLRNTTAPLPKFAETFIDDGFMDICEIAKVLVKSKYKGMVILDHTPPFDAIIEEGDMAATCFTLGYIKSAIRSAQVFLG